jgi:hypothetical protein
VANGLLVFVVDVVFVVGFEVELVHDVAFVAEVVIFWDQIRQPRTRIHTKPNNKFDRPVDEKMFRTRERTSCTKC